MYVCDICKYRPTERGNLCEDCRYRISRRRWNSPLRDYAQEAAKDATNMRMRTPALPASVGTDLQQLQRIGRELDGIALLFRKAERSE